MAASRTFLQSASDTANATSYTFSSQNLGTAASDRYIVVCASSRALGTSEAKATAITVGGVSATIVANVQNAVTNLCTTAIAIVAVPTGTTGDVVVTYPREMLRATVDLYRVVGVDPSSPSTGTDTAHSPDTTASASVNVPADGVAFAAVFTGQSTNTDSWTNLTEDAEYFVETAARASVASAEFASEQTGLAITATGSAAYFETSFAVAAFGPATAGGFQAAWARGSNVLIGV